MIIRQATLEDIQKISEHDIRHMQELGFNNLPAHPFPTDYPFEIQNYISRKEKSYSTLLGLEGWSRSFIAIENDTVVGHINLKNIFIGTLHRAELGMGIETPFRGRGLGKELMSKMLEWARDQEFLFWIDLKVFAHNLPAQKLYRSFGFTEITTIKDQIRVNDQSIDDTIMVLKLK